MTTGKLPPLDVYVIDDDADTRRSVVQLVRSMNAKTYEFGSAEEFLAAYRGSPGVLICDVRMPGMTGLELQTALATHDVFLPIVLMTGFCRTNVVVQAIRNGATTVLEKPFTKEDLLLAMHEALTDYRSGIEPYTAIQNARGGLASLTDSEREVLRLLKLGRSHKEIALEFDVSVRTVVFRRKKIFEKMNVDNMIDLFRQLVLVEADDNNRSRLRHLGKHPTGIARR